MRTYRLFWIWPAALALSFSPWTSHAPAQPPKEKYDGATACKDCHTQPNAERSPSLPFVTLTEYAIWKLEDKHAQAFAVLKTKRSERIGELLGVNILKPEAGCLNCHAMQQFQPEAKETFTLQDGVSCAGCHGPSENWLGPHADASWRKKTPAEKAKAGMADLRDPVRRGELCMSCHVGNAAEGKVVTHAMFAAGHPPLPPFDLALFSENMPRHWREPAEVPFYHILDGVSKLAAMEKPAYSRAVREILSNDRGERIGEVELTKFINLYPTPDEAKKILGNYPFAGAATERTRLSLTGNAVAVATTMQLVSDRAGQHAPKDGFQIWPDLRPKKGDGEIAVEKLPEVVNERWADLALAHSDCYSCHHDLAYPGYRQERGYGYRLLGSELIPIRPGRPPVRTWSFSLAGVALDTLAPEGPDGRGARKMLEGRLKILADACLERPFGAPDAVGKAAEEAAQQCRGALKEGTGRALPISAVRQVLARVCREGAANLLDYESARVVGSFLVAVSEDLHDPQLPERFRTVLARTEKELNLRPYVGRNDRRKLIQEAVAKLAGSEVIAGEAFWQSVDKLSDMQLLLKLRGNDLLGALRDKITNEDLNEAMQKDIVNKLEDVATRELKNSLEAIRTFNPRQFQKELQQAAEALGHD
jgi:hypothetical protein